MKRFWKEYKRALFALENFCRLRPMFCRQLTLIESDEYDTVILPVIPEITKGARLSTKSSIAEMRLFREEIHKIENIVEKINKGRYKEKE